MKNSVKSKIKELYYNENIPKYILADMFNVDLSVIQKLTNEIKSKENRKGYDLIEFNFTDNGTGMYCDFYINPILGYHE